jgi:hypothetical protein
MLGESSPLAVSDGSRSFRGRPSPLHATAWRTADVGPRGNNNCGSGDVTIATILGRKFSPLPAPSFVASKISYQYKRPSELSK